jgi:hypothetical protein
LTQPTRFARARARLRRPSAAGLLLLVVLAALSFAMSTRGYLGTDTGAKVATLDVMDERGTARPVLGYWAEDFDPGGTLHPIYDARPVDGDWVHVTTLPMLELGRPLWALGGYRLTLVLPMLGTMGAAFAARSLARRIGDEGVGWHAFWMVGLGSPLVVYALDFWEHAPGVACMFGAVALLAGVVDGDPPVSRAIGAGFLLGVSATLRTETFVYALVTVGACVIVCLVRTKAVRLPLQAGILAVVGFAPPWFANALLEGALGGNSRGQRVGRKVSSSLFDRLDERWREAVTTLLALRPDDTGRVIVLGGLTAILIVGALLADRRGLQGHARGLLAAAIVLHVASALGGFGFVPGLVAAAPVALASFLVARGSPAARYAFVVAVAALPLVWGTQPLGGAGPQWAGRYALTSCVILMTLGLVGVAGLSREVRFGLVALTIFVSGTGLLWLNERSHSFEDLFDGLVDRPEDVIISRNGFFIREGGEAYTERLWLTAVTDDDLARAAEVVDEAGHDTFAVLDDRPDAVERLPGAGLTGTTRVTVVGIPLYLHSYAL